MKKVSIIAACLLSAAAFTNPASAETVRSSTVVEIADLKLSSPAGQKRLEQRLAAAVRKVCGRHEVRNLAERRQYMECAGPAKAAAQNAKLAAIDAAQRAAFARSGRRGNARS